jgi:hypothetical protein
MPKPTGSQSHAEYSSFKLSTALLKTCRHLKPTERKSKKQPTGGRITAPDILIREIRERADFDGWPVGAVRKKYGLTNQRAWSIMTYQVRAAIKPDRDNRVSNPLDYRLIIPQGK